MIDLPWFFVFSVCVPLYVGLREAVLAQLNALLNGVLDLEHVYWCLVGSAGDNMQRWVENDILDDGIARPST